MRKFDAGYYDYVIFQFWDKTDVRETTLISQDSEARSLYLR